MGYHRFNYERIASWSILNSTQGEAQGRNYVLF
jgi:hypothetical protein